VFKIQGWFMKTTSGFLLGLSIVFCAQGQLAIWTGWDPVSLENNGFGEPARAGYASLSNQTFEFNGSGSAAALLDSNLTTGLIYNSFNSTVPGRYVFQFHNGVPSGHPETINTPSRYCYIHCYTTFGILLP